MGNLGRVACITLPFVLTIGALVSLIFVTLGSTSASSSTLDSLYFARVDMSNLSTSAGDLQGIASEAIGSDQQLLKALDQAEKDADLRDFYDIGLWGYCAGNKTSKGNFEVDYCSPKEASFWFNPVAIWKLNNTGISELLPSNLQSGLNTYEKISKWMFIAYMIAIGTTALELVIGISAICSRLGSCVTTLVSVVSTLFTVAASVTSTALFAVLTGIVNTSLKEYHVTATLGTHMLAVTWLAAAFSIASGLFWSLSSCCCPGSTGHGRRGGRGRVVAEKAPYTYERVNAPYVGGAGGAPDDNHGASDTIPLYQPERSSMATPYHNRSGSEADIAASPDNRFYNSGRPDSMYSPPVVQNDAYEPFRHQQTKSIV